jgi:prevent-host-death family protein
MPHMVSSSEAQNNFGAMMQWAEENNDEVVVERRGKPAAVLISYEEYKSIVQLKEQERKRKAFEALEKLRREVQRKNPNITAEEAYRAAGFSKEVIQATLKSDEELRQSLRRLKRSK